MDGNAEQGEQGMAGKKWDDAAVAAVMRGVNARGVAKWGAEGPGWKIKTDGTPADNAGGLEALRALLEVAQAAKARSLHVAEMAAKPKAPRAPARPVAPVVHVPTLGEAIAAYEVTEVPTLTPDTWAQRQRSFRTFAAAVGANTPINEITRQMASAWATELMRGGLTKRYLANQTSHISQLFEAQIRTGHLPGPNPVRSVVVMK